MASENTKLSPVIKKKRGGELAAPFCRMIGEG